MRRKAIALLTLVLYLLAGPGNALAEYVCGQDLNGDGFADGEGETAQCLQSGTDWLCPVGAVDCVQGYAEPGCPAGGTLNPDRDMCQAAADVSCPIGYVHDPEIDRCVLAVECPEGGTFNPVTDRCEKIVQNECPTGYTYDAAQDLCRKTVDCSPGSLNSSRDRCEAPPNWDCPTGYSYDSSLMACTANPSCPAGSAYHPGRDRCEKTATNQCPTGYTYDAAIDNCVRAADCPAPSMLNAGTDRCEVAVGYDCPTGYTYNASRNQCEKSPACLSPGAYSSGADKCQSPITGILCPSGYNYDTAQEICISSPTCVGGIFNASTDRCETVPSFSCPDPSYSYNTTSGRCEKAPLCSEGTYSSTYDRCLLDFTKDCPSGYAYQASRGRCEKAPECSSGYSFNQITGKCETPAATVYQCSQGGQQFSTLSQCQSSCSQTATCNALIYLTGVVSAPKKVFYGSGSRLITDSGYFDFGPNAMVTGGDTSIASTSSLCFRKIYGSGNRLCLNIGYSKGCLASGSACVTIDGATISGAINSSAGWSIQNNSQIVSTRQECARATRVGCAEWKTVTETISFGGSSCPLAGGTCDANNICSVSGTCVEAVGNCPAGSTQSGSTCQTSPTCSGGTMDYSLGVCQAPFTPNCPTGMTYDAAANKCVMAASCQNGLLDGLTDRCYQTADSGCPSGYLLSGGKCIKAPSCGSGGSFSPATDSCTSPASFTCSSGYTFNPASGNCERAADCPSPGSLNGSVDMCQASVTSTCPSGFTKSGNICFRETSCASPGSYSSVQDQCLSAVDRICGTGFTYDGSSGICWAGPGCGGGTFNKSSDRCEAAATVNCGSWSWDGTDQVCYSPAICDLGVYNPSANECRAAITRNCGSYLWNEAETKCTQGVQCPNQDPSFPISSTIAFSPDLDICVSNAQHDCPTGYAYTGLPVSMCEAAISCPGGPYDPERNQCEDKDACPLGSQYACLGEQGSSQCSPNPCFDLAAPGNDMTELHPEDPMLQNDGGVDANGNCLGQIYIFSGKATRCRPPGATVGYANDCCDSDEPALTDSTTGPRINQVVTAIQTVYEVAQVGYYAYQISTGAMAAVEVGGQVMVYNMATGSIAATYASGTATASGVVAAQGAAAAGATSGGAVSAGLSSYAGALLNPTTIAVAIVVMVVMKVLFGNGCDQRDIESSLLDDSGYCIYLGKVCERKWPMVGCVQRAKRFCCFNSKMARIVQEQGRPQLKSFGQDGGWGSAENPNCRGFTPEEFQQLDFSLIDLTEYFGEIQKDMTQKIQDAQSAVQEKIQQHYQQIQ